MRLIYALIMIAGFAFLLWSIDRSMPVYADAVEWKEDIIMDSVTFPMCDGESDLTTDGCILTYNSDDNCFYCTHAKDPLKECEEELASCQAQLDSCLPSEFGPPQATPLYYEDHPVIRR